MLSWDERKKHFMAFGQVPRYFGKYHVSVVILLNMHAKLSGPYRNLNFDVGL